MHCPALCCSLGFSDWKIKFFKIYSELQGWSVLCFNVFQTLRFCCSLCKDDSDNFSSILKTGDSTTKGSLITWLTFQKIWSYHQKIIPKQCVHTSTFWRHSVTEPTKYSHIPQTRQTWKYFTSPVPTTLNIDDDLKSNYFNVYK